MPFLDVDDVLLDPDFCESLTVTRDDQTIGTNGRLSSNATTFSIIGVVTIPNIPETGIVPEGQVSRRTIIVHTQTRLLDNTTGTTPDIIAWNGNNYRVRESGNWSNYGQGFSSVKCDMIDLVGAS